MVASSDILRLPFTPDLTEGGIAYAIRSLPYTYDRMGGSPFNRLRRIVAGVAVELVFRRFLSEQDIPFEVRGATPFTDPDRYDVSLGGHRCDIKSFLITYREQIAEMRRNPEILLNAPALVPSDQHAGEGHSDHDIYMFAFLSGLLAASQEDLKKAIAAGQPHYLVHAMPNEWCKPQSWRPLGPLTLKSESDAALTLEIGGQDEGRGFLMRTVELPPQMRVVVDDQFYSVASIHLKHPTDARIGIRSSQINELHAIHPPEWGNIWVYGMDIFLAGYISREEFRRDAAMIPQGTHVFQYEHTKTKNLAVRVSDLKPLADLFSKVREWHSNQSDA
jgi:hypothetical protein